MNLTARLVLNEEQRLLSEMARQVVNDLAPLTTVRTLRDAGSTTGWSDGLWDQAVDLGWPAIPFSPDQGGLGLGLAELAVVMEALGGALAHTPMLSTVILAGGALAGADNEALRRAWVPRIVEGGTQLAFAAETGAGGRRIHRVECRDGILKGTSAAVLDGGVAEAFVVAANESVGVGLYLVSADAPGLSVVPLQRLDNRGAARLVFEGVAVGPESALVSPGTAGPLVEQTLDRGRVALAAEMLGSMRAALQMTLDHLNTREQFGVPIGSFQALQHRVVDLFIQTELARSVVMAASRVAGEELPKLASLAQARCSDTFVAVACEAIQMYGGIGMTDEHDIGFFLKRARVAEQTLGNAAWHRARWAALSGY